MTKPLLKGNDQFKLQARKSAAAFGQKKSLSVQPRERDFLQNYQSEKTES